MADFSILMVIGIFQYELLWTKKNNCFKTTYIYGTIGIQFQYKTTNHALANKKKKSTLKQNNFLSIQM